MEMKGKRKMTESIGKETIVAEEANTASPGSTMLSMKSGNTMFLIGIYFSKTSNQTLDDKVRKMIQKDVENGNF